MKNMKITLHISKILLFFRLYHLKTPIIFLINFEKIISFLKGKKASVLQFPERIEFIESMPFTKAEKVDKSFLREDIKRKINDEK